jgi:hypothetical protein
MRTFKNNFSTYRFNQLKKQLLEKLHHKLETTGKNGKQQNTGKD